MDLDKKSGPKPRSVQTMLFEGFRKGAILATEDQKQSLISTDLWLESPKLKYHFGPSKAIFEKRNMKFQKIEKRKFIVQTPKGAPFGKKIKKIQKLNFTCS